MIPLVTQPYYGDKLIPLGVVRATVRGDNIRELDAEMRNLSPTGTAILHNYKWEFVDYPIGSLGTSTMLSGTADAWANPPRTDLGPK